MRPRLAPLISASLLWLLGIGLSPTLWNEQATAADAPTLNAPALTAQVPVAREPDADEVLEEALELERRYQWSEAIDRYEKALKRWPDRVEFRHRLRLCESHYRLGRRYHDRSFREVLLQLPRSEALGLFDEVLDRIQTHYVDPVSLAPLLRGGLDNLEVALRDPVFLKANAPDADPARIHWLRQTLASQRSRIIARDRREAEALVAWACDLGRSAIGLEAAPIVLEFAYGACGMLDDYTIYLTPDKLDDLFAVIDGNFVGLGVELKEDPQGLRLVGVISGGPAAEAGLKIGDRITSIANERLAGLSLDEAASKLQGPEGTALELTILDEKGHSRSIRLIRREVEVRSVSQAKIVDPTAQIGYIQLDGFQKNTIAEMKQAIEALENQGMRVLVLDLRGNPGGLLDVAIEMADEFLDGGVIVSTRGRAAHQSAIYRADPGVSWAMPLVVLIDHDSASASEILAGALKDNGRAVVLGETSYGKGSVQSIFPLRGAPAGLKLTTAKFYSPKNLSYSERGVVPDVRVHLAARPAGDDSDAESLNLSAANFGDPAKDLFLERAIVLVRSQEQSSR